MAANSLAATPTEMDSCVSTLLPRMRGTIAWTRLPDGAVLFSPESEVYYSMNGVAAMVWELLQRHTELETLCAELNREFPDATPEQILEDVLELLAELERSGLVDQPAGDAAA